MNPQSPRELPSVDRLLQEEPVRRLVEREGHDLVVAAARTALSEARAALLNGGSAAAPDYLPERVEQHLRGLITPRLRPVINATGVIIHTNLGRAPLSEDALRAVQAAAEGYTNLEYDLDAGERGSRHHLVTDLLKRLTGAEDAVVVNNNASALLIVLSALAQGREGIISRGQLVEIGGGFRIPDVMAQSGVRLVEVGTTNRTYAADFARAITDQTALLMRVHASNFAQVGFIHSPTLEELAAVAAERNLPLVDDLGSGSFVDTTPFGLAQEPMAQDSVRAGASLVCFSGDKLLGGPQAGIVIGRADLVARIKKHPLMRAVRPDKMTLAALGATLLHYVRGEAEQKVPIWRMIAADLRTLDARAQTLAARLSGPVQVVETEAAVGGGSLPGQALPSRALALRPDRLAAVLRHAEVPVIGRVERDRVLLDLRSVLPEQDALLLHSLRKVLQP